MNNELQQHKSADTVKWILTLIAFILVGIMIIGIILGWFEKKETKQEQHTDTAQTGGMVMENSVGGEISLMSAAIPVEEYAANDISPQADSAYTVQAVVYPELATNRNVIWSLAWKNETDGWAKDKPVTEYVTFTEVAGAQNTVRVVCQKGFNAQIVLKAASESEPFIAAEVPIDYVKRVIGMTVTFKGTDRLKNNATVSRMLSTGNPSPFGGNVDVYSFSWDEDIQVTEIVCNAFFSNVGTVNDNYTYGCTWKHSSSWIAAQDTIEAGRNHFCSCANDGTVHSGASCNCGKKLNIGRYLGVCDSSVAETLRTNSAGGVTFRNLYQSMVRNHYCMEFTLFAFGDHCTYQRIIACNFDDSEKIAAEQVETTASSGLFF